jgi:hypothetical protein
VYSESERYTWKLTSASNLPYHSREPTPKASLESDENDETSLVHDQTMIFSRDEMFPFTRDFPCREDPPCHGDFPTQSTSPVVGGKLSGIDPGRGQSSVESQKINRKLTQKAIL